MTQSSLALIAGCGPGLGAQLLLKLDLAGFEAFGLSRTSGADPRILPVDLCNPVAVSEAVHGLIGCYGLSFTTRRVCTSHPLRARKPATLNGSGVTSSYRRYIWGMPSSRQWRLRGGARFSAFASAKAGLRSLTQSLAREYGPKGVHMAHVVLDGILDTTASRVLHDTD
jgi:NAD(P)-dependent dehydrogenase (short-subunit alcohol dehydrogenase family)